MRIVLDTNVLIAAFISRGLCSEILEACLKSHQLILSEVLADEVRKNLTQKFHISSSDAEEYLHVLALHSEWVHPPKLAKRVSRDVKDDAILSTAAEGKAAYLVTGDKDLLTVKGFGSTRIVPPRVFWEEVVGDG